MFPNLVDVERVYMRHVLLHLFIGPGGKITVRTQVFQG